MVQSSSREAEARRGGGAGERGEAIHQRSSHTHAAEHADSAVTGSNERFAASRSDRSIQIHTFVRVYYIGRCACAYASDIPACPPSRSFLSRSHADQRRVGSSRVRVGNDH